MRRRALPACRSACMCVVHTHAYHVLAVEEEADVCETMLRRRRRHPLPHRTVRTSTNEGKGRPPDRT